MSEIKLKRFENGFESQEWSCESPKSSFMLEHTGEEENVKSRRGKRKTITDVTSSKNRECEKENDAKRKCLSHLNKVASSELTRKEGQVEHTSGGNLLKNETPPNSSVTENLNDCNEINGGTESVSPIANQSLEANIYCGIEDISEASSDSDTISDHSFLETSYADVRNANYGNSAGKCSTTRMSSCPTLVLDSYHRMYGWDPFNKGTITRINEYNSDTFEINCNRNSNCDLNENNLGLTREKNNKSESKLKEERVLQEIPDMCDNKPASPSQVSKFTFSLNQHSAEKKSSVAESIDKNVDGAPSTSTPIHVGKYFSSNCDSFNVHDNTLRTDFSKTTIVLPPNVLRDSTGRLFYDVKNAIWRPTPIKYKEIETINLTPERTKITGLEPVRNNGNDLYRQNNFSTSYGFPSATRTGSSEPSISAKKQVKSAISHPCKALMCPSCDFIALSVTDLGKHKMHAHPSEGTNNPVTPNPMNTNALNYTEGLVPNNHLNFDGNPRFRHQFYSPTYPLQRRVTPYTEPYYNFAGSRNYWVDPKNPHVNLTRLQCPGARSNLVNSSVNSSLGVPVHINNSKENMEKVFGCFVCGNFWTDSLHDLIQHALTDRSYPDDSILLDGKYLHCRVCNFETPTQLVMEVHCKSWPHLQKVGHSNHFKEGGLKSPFSKLVCQEVKGTICLGCNVCSFYSEILYTFEVHCISSQHIHNVNFRNFQNSFETKKEYYFCKSCDVAVVSKENLFQHSNSNEHKAAESILADYGNKNLGGLYIVKETRLNEESFENLQNNIISSKKTTNKQSLQVDSKKTNNLSTSSPHQSDSKKSTKKVPINSSCKDFKPRQTDASHPEVRNVFCSLCNSGFPDVSECLFHITKCNGVAENRAKMFRKEIVPEKQISSGEEQITETSKDLNTASDAKQNIATNITGAVCFPKRNMNLSELNSLELQGVNSILPILIHNNKGFSPLSDDDIYSSSGCKSESSEIDVG